MPPTEYSRVERRSQPDRIPKPPGGRTEALSALAAALADGGHVKVQLGASTLKLHVPDQVRCEVDVEVDGDEVELELELKWSTVRS